MHKISQLEQAASILLTRRLSGDKGEVLVSHLRPTDNQSAFAIQQTVSHLYCEQMQDSVGAWKCLQPIESNWVVAPIFTRTINTIPPITILPEQDMARIEPELAFYFAKDLPLRQAPYLPDEIDAAIGRSHMALELIYNRFTDANQASHFDKLADGLFNQGLYVGPQVNGTLAKQATNIEITLSYAGQIQIAKGQHPNLLPRAPLYWLVEFLRQQGIGIQAGQAVITGSYAGVFAVPLNTDITLSYAGLGEMQLHFKTLKRE